MRGYEINENTLALISIDKNKTEVLENNDIFIINKSATNIMNDSCSYFGSSLSGRQKGTKSLTGLTHKAPVIVEESKEIIFFPTTSPRLEQCSWISLNNFEKLLKDKESNIILFKNNQKLRVNLSNGVIMNQILRATRLESVLRNRKKI